MTLIRVARVAVPTTLLALVACDLTVTNPGPVQATFLENTAALNAVVNGAGRDLAEALNWVAYTSAAVTRELHPAGSTAAFGISVRQQAGVLAIDDGGDWWNQGQRARWTADSAVGRVRGILGTAANNSATLAQALIWQGYSSRFMGENFCDAVINGGPQQPYTVYLERAEAAFTEAITVATAANNTALREAAIGGRASVRLLRNNPTGAAADAALITNNAFAYRMPYFTQTVDQYNRIFWASANQPYRAHTVWNTFYDAYRKQSRDSRVPYDSSLTILVGDAAVGNLGRVRWYFQTKHSAIGSSINLSSGWEMRLIEAEALLISGDWQTAMTRLNARRLALSLTPWVATNATEAWTHLKRERGIELWLEGRRLGDMRRWAALNRPGPTDDMTGRSVCFPIPLSELETNPNLTAPGR
jgi:starch-binding outer membrane protein, SusD/RagB family